jgi:hypothetical protein
MTWEEKIDSLVRLAKAAGRYTNAEPGTDYYRDARRELFDAYEEFCQWRHEEPYVVDEIKQLLEIGEHFAVTTLFRGLYK